MKVEKGKKEDEKRHVYMFIIRKVSFTMAIRCDQFTNDVGRRIN